MKHLTTKWEKIWRKRNNKWEYKGSLRGTRTQMAGVPGRSLCSRGFILHWTHCGHSLAQTSCTNLLGLHRCFFFYQAPEPDDVVVEPPEEFLNRLRAAGMSTDIWWKLRKQLPGRRRAGQRWVYSFHVCVNGQAGFHGVRERTAVFLEPRETSGMEVHMDDLHGFGPV